MPTYKVTYVFNQGRMGWSETWYITKSQYTPARTAAVQLGSFRSKFLALGNKIEAIRVSDIAKPRMCGLTIPGGYKNAEFPTDTPWQGLLITVCAQDLYRRSFIARGIPDDWIEFDGLTGEFKLKDIVFTAMKPFIDALKGEPWQLKVISKEDVDLGLGQIGSATVTPENKLKILYTNPAVQPGETIRMTGWTGPDAKVLNNVYRVLANDGTFITIDLNTTLLLNLAEDKGGKAVRRKTIYVPITDVSPFRYVKRDTGRAFFVPRGRRRVVK